MRENFLWVEKYRPSTVQECILPTELKSTFQTFVDEGDWGTNKKIISFHNLDISGQPSGTSVKWKIETLNQGTGSSRNTRIHAASMGWK